MPCENGGTCLTNHKYDNFECHCDKGFIGEYCEKAGRLPMFKLEMKFLFLSCFNVILSPEKVERLLPTMSVHMIASIIRE